MPVQLHQCNLSMRGSQEIICFHQSENLISSSSKSVALEVENNGLRNGEHKVLHHHLTCTSQSRAVNDMQNTSCACNSVSMVNETESDYMPYDTQTQIQPAVPEETDYEGKKITLTKRFSPSKFPFQRRYSMQTFQSNPKDNVSKMAQLNSGKSRHGSIPCIASASSIEKQLSSPHSIKAKQLSNLDSAINDTTPNPFPELINSPPLTPLISHGRSQSSCIDDRLQSVDQNTINNSTSALCQCSENSLFHSSINKDPQDDVMNAISNLGFTHSHSAGSISSIVSGSSMTPLIPNSDSASHFNPSTGYSSSPFNNSYVHSSVIAARAKHIMNQSPTFHSNSSPTSSPLTSKRRTSSSSVSNRHVNSRSPLISSGSLDNPNNITSAQHYIPHHLNTLSSAISRNYHSSSPQSDSPTGSTTGRISPDRVSNLYEQSSALWSAQGYTKQMLMVYTDENNYKTVTIEGNMTASDVSDLLIEKCKATPDKSWSIVEKLSKFDMERSLEDHELVYAIYRGWGKAENNRFLFQKDYKKYEMFHNPAQFFPPNMLDWKDANSPKSSPKLSQKPSDRHTNLLFKNLINNSEQLPDIQGHMSMKEGKKSWKKHFFVLRKSGLYYSVKNNSKEPKHLTLFSHLNDVNIYTASNSKKMFGSPNNFCICLKPSHAVSDVKELKLLCAEDETSRLCWVAALRLIKYGSGIRDNFKKMSKAEKKKREADCNENSTCVSNSKLNVKSRVAMDFTGSGGRVVDDPNEAVGVAIAEGQHWRKKAPRGHHSPANVESPCQATSFLSENPVKCGHGLSSGIHMAMSWFHHGITRDQAVQLIHEDGVVDGVFLVRESQSMAGCYVLSLAHNGKVKHCTIKTFDDDEDLYFSMDGGHTRFSDIIQLVEFYQLNANGLPTKLTHFVSRLV